MIEERQAPVAAGLARALDGLKGELLKLSAIAAANGLSESSNKIGDLAVEVSKLSLDLEKKARERYIAARQDKVP